MAKIDYDQQRKEDLAAIINSSHGKRVVVAGPGTGKSYLLQKAIEKKQEEGKTEFLAITFIGQLGDALADDLAGLATTTTMHSFARDFVLKNKPRGWVYYPKIKDVISEDLKTQGITEFDIGDENYVARSEFYKTVGEDDVVYYATQICRANEEKIPKKDLILVDEFQDFNEIEDSFISLLASKNDVLIVGDDDQALYRFKKSDPKYIREKHNIANIEFESHTLRWCSRCPEVVVKAFHSVVDQYRTSLTGRIDKDYFCYVPDKEKDSKANPKICVLTTPPGMIAYKIKTELNDLLKTQKIKTVLVIGEGKTCKSTLATVARLLKEYGFKNVRLANDQNKPFEMKSHIIDGYKAMSQSGNFVLGWRLLINELDEATRIEIITTNFNSTANFLNAIPEEFKTLHTNNSLTLKKLLEEPASTRRAIGNSTITKLQESIVLSKKEERELLVDQILQDNKYLERPLVNLDITVCNILGSKGLGADVVFLIGFDQGKLPAKTAIDDSEIYQLLVALTRTKKRIYLINTSGCRMSSFLEAIGSDNYCTS